MNYSTTFKNFIQCNQSKICVMLREGLVKEDFCDYVAIRGEMLTYMPHGREQKFNDAGRWIREGRQEIKPAKLMRKILTDDAINTLTDADFEKFTNLLKSFVGCNGCDENAAQTILKVVNGEFISHYYTLELNDDKVNGSNLAGSCMQGKPSSYFDIYVKNPSVCSLAVLLDGEGDLLGRALIWAASDGQKLMDTIYTNEKHMDIFKKFATDNGMKYKFSQSCHHHHFDGLSPNDFGRREVMLENSSFSNYPYMDTFYFLDGKILSNESDSNEYLELRDTNGGYEEICENPMVYDDETGEDINEDEAVYLDYRTPTGDSFCGYTHEDRCVTAYTDRGGREERLERHCFCINGDYYEYGHSEIVYSQYLNEDVHIDDVVYSEFCEDYIPRDEAIMCEETGEWFLEGDYSNFNLKTNEQTA